jgi:glycerol transport system ATP-binding protein
MELTLERIEKQVGPQTHLYPLDLTLVPRAVTVLLGATQAGKTTLMRLMAGLDVPSKGRVKADGVDVTGRPVRERNVAMVYQQFINYPSMTVADNIASPLKLRREPGIDARVAELAAKLHIEPFLQRLPAELSGGQQQRVALARALAKNAPLMLLDEPLVNLDYKLREELRNELSQLFAAGTSTVVYATTEPTEALLLGGYTAVMEAGELLQYGPTAEVFHRPKSIRVARAFSDPPMNMVTGQAAMVGVMLPGGVNLAVPLSDKLSAEARAKPLTIGIRANALRVRGRDGDTALAGKVELAEIAGSDTFVHVDTPIGELVAQLTGVHQFTLGAPITLFLDPAQVHVFDAAGDLVVAPRETR